MTTETRLPAPEPVSAYTRRVDPVWRAAHLDSVRDSQYWRDLLARGADVPGWRGYCEEQLLGAAWLSERMLIAGMGDKARAGLLRIYADACLKAADCWLAAEAVWKVAETVRGGR